MKTALITGIGGQDGTYLTELLLEKGYTVHGVTKNSKPNGVKIHEADLTDADALRKLVEKVNPAEIYNLASPSFVPNSWLEPQMTSELSGLGVLKLLEAIRLVNPKIKFFQASSSELFGQPAQSPQCETTPFNPINPYAVAKLYGHLMTGLYRRQHGMFAVSGIMYNHESPRRSQMFVTRKITQAVAKIKAGKADKVTLGNLETVRDWGYAKDYVLAMWKALQTDAADDYVVSTGIGHTVREWAEAAFSFAGLDYKKHVEVDQKFWRPAEKFPLIGDNSKAVKKLNWKPSMPFKELVQQMTEADIKKENACQV